MLYVHIIFLKNNKSSYHGSYKIEKKRNWKAENVNLESIDGSEGTITGGGVRGPQPRAGLAVGVQRARVVAGVVLVLCNGQVQR